MTSTPPWAGQPQPDYMPRLRRHFADSLPERLQTADAALDALASSEPPPEDARKVSPARALHLFAHSLGGTAPSVGAEEIGELGYHLAEFTRGWESLEGGPGPEQLEEARRRVEEIRRAAHVYRGWVDGDASD